MESYFALLPKEIFDQIHSGIDFVSYWRLGSSCKRFLDLLIKPNEYWLAKYAKDYSLNAQELACYNFDDWLDLYKQRVMNELNFLKEIEEARNWMQITEDTLEVDEDENEHLMDNWDLVQEVQHTMIRGRVGYEFKPGHNPYYTLLTSNNITEINFALKTILYGFLRGESATSHRMIDVLITAISKNISAHPQLFIMLSTKNLGLYIYNSDLNLPRALRVPIGSISLILATLHINSLFLRETIHLLNCIPIHDSRIARVWSHLKVSERAFDILYNRELIGLDFTETTIVPCLKLILLADVPHRSEALQNIVCEVLEHWHNDDLMHSVYHKDLLRVTKKVFKDFKGNDMSLVNRLIEVAVHRRKVSQALAALALCTDQSEEALQLCANHEGLLDKVIRKTSSAHDSWVDGLTLMKNLLQTDVGRERLWHLKQFNQMHIAYNRVAATQEHQKLFLAVLTKFNEIALSKPTQKHEVTEVLKTWDLHLLTKTMLKKARNKFWISYLKLDPPLSDEFLSEFISVLSRELNYGGKPPLNIALLETILELRPYAFDVKNVTNLYNTLSAVAIFGTEDNNDFNFRCELLTLFIHLLSLEKVVKKASNDENIINSAIDLCNEPATPVHFKVLILSYLGFFLTSTKTWRFAAKAKEAIERFVTKISPNNSEWSAIITSIKPFKHLLVQKTSNDCTALLGAWILLYFSSHEKGREEIKDPSAAKWLDKHVSKLRQLF